MLIVSSALASLLSTFTLDGSGPASVSALIIMTQFFCGVCQPVVTVVPEQCYNVLLILGWPSSPGCPSALACRQQ